MKVFYLLKNGEIREGEGARIILLEDKVVLLGIVAWDAIPTEIEGIKVLAAASTREAIDGVREAIFADEESLIGTGKAKKVLTPIDVAYLAERGYSSSMN